MRQWVMPVVVCALAGACRQAKPPSPPAPVAAAPAAPAPAEAPAWRATSANGEWTVEQFVDASGACRAAARSRQAAGWTTTTCLASTSQLAFLSNDGQTLLVLEPTPRFVDGAWEPAEVARRFVKGVLADRTQASALVANGDKLTRYTHYFGWAKGAGGLGGDAPRLAPDGAAVLLETADGRTARLSFDGPPSVSPVPEAPVAAAAPAGPPPAAAPGCGAEQLCQYVDAQGTTQFVNGAEVPERYRAKARPVDAQLGLMETAAPVPPPQAQAMNDAVNGADPAPTRSGITVTIPRDDVPAHTTVADSAARQSQLALMLGNMDHVAVVAGAQYPGCSPDLANPHYVYCPKFLNRGPKTPVPAAQPAPAAQPVPPAPVHQQQAPARPKPPPESSRGGAARGP